MRTHRHQMSSPVLLVLTAAQIQPGPDSNRLFNVGRQPERPWHPCMVRWRRLAKSPGAPPSPRCAGAKAAPLIHSLLLPITLDRTATNPNSPASHHGVDVVLGEGRPHHDWEHRCHLQKQARPGAHARLLCRAVRGGAQTAVGGSVAAAGANPGNRPQARPPAHARILCRAGLHGQPMNGHTCRSSIGKHPGMA